MVNIFAVNADYVTRSNSLGENASVFKFSLFFVSEDKKFKNLSSRPSNQTVCLPTLPLLPLVKSILLLLQHQLDHVIYHIHQHPGLFIPSWGSA